MAITTKNLYNKLGDGNYPTSLEYVWFRVMLCWVKVTIH